MECLSHPCSGNKVEEGMERMQEEPGDGTERCEMLFSVYDMALYP